MNSYTMKELLSGYFEERYLAVDEVAVPELHIRHNQGNIEFEDIRAPYKPNFEHSHHRFSASH